MSKMSEYRFKRNKESRRGGWIQARYEPKGEWCTLVYCHSLRSANRWVNKAIKSNEKPDIYISLPLIEAIG